jgi:hypothetical protein
MRNPRVYIKSGTKSGDTLPTRILEGEKSLQIVNEAQSPGLGRGGHNDCGQRQVELPHWERLTIELGAETGVPRPSKDD